jgi:hypothetical protein
VKIYANSHSERGEGGHGAQETLTTSITVGHKDRKEVVVVKVQHEKPHVYRLQIIVDGDTINKEVEAK